MGRTTALAALVALALCTGCGDEPAGKQAKQAKPAAAHKPKSNAAPALDRRAVLSDFRAMLQANLMAGALESCFAETDSFLRCRRIRVPGVPRGRGAGQVRVEVTRDIYRVTGHSRTGNTFRVRLPSLPSFQHFDCTAKTGEGACRSGRWYIPPSLGAPTDRVAADLVAQQQVRIAAAYVERCFSDSRTFARCTTKDELEPYAPEIDPSLRLGTGPGEVKVTRARRRTYSVAARSRSGAIFRATVTAHRAKLTCSAKRSGGACRNGRWSDGEEQRRNDDVLPEAEWT